MEDKLIQAVYQLAVAEVCPHNKKPTTPYEVNLVGYLVRFAIKVMEFYIFENKLNEE